MACSCLKNDFNIYVYTEDCKTLVIEDHSMWMDDKGYHDPDTLKVELIFPEGNKKEININPRSKNIFKAEDINNGNKFDDGIYCFKATSCEVTYSVYRIISCQAENSLREVKARMDVNSTDEEWNQLWKLEGYLEVAKSAAKYEQLSKSQTSLDLFYDELQNLNCCI